MAIESSGKDTPKKLGSPPTLTEDVPEMVSVFEKSRKRQ